MIYATQQASTNQQQNMRISGAESPNQQLHGMILNSKNSGTAILQTSVGRSMSNDRGSSQWGQNSGSLRNQSLQDSGPIPMHPTKGRGGLRSNAPGLGYRSTGRGGMGINTAAGHNQHGNTIFLNAELKGVLTNQSRKSRANNSLTMTMGNTVIDGVSNMTRSINNTYNLRSNGNSPTNFNSGLPNNSNNTNNNKLVRYKNSNHSNSRTVSPLNQPQMHHNVSLGHHDGRNYQTMDPNSKSVSIGKPSTMNQAQ